MAANTRALAARVLGEVLAGRSLNQVLPPALEQASPRDRGLLQQLCYGTLRHAPRLQGLLDQLLSKPLKSKDSDIQGLLLSGLYQLEETRIPDHAAVAETVGATRNLKKNWARGMANAVLRRYQREREQLLATLEPAAARSHPQWLFRALHSQWPNQAEAIIEANNQQPPMTLRVNRARLSREEYLAHLAEAGIPARAGAIAPEAICLESPCEVTALPGFEHGEASVQDEGAQLAAVVLAAQPDERVLDACAAPGGKSCHILERQPALEELVSMDIDSSRLARVQDNMERLELSAHLVTGDGGKPPAELALASFDRILVDAPCSASGVIRRHPDVKLLRRERDIEEFGRQQLAILAGLWPLLKPGGCLLYVTCSVLEAENDSVVRHFLADTPDSEGLPIDAPWGVATDTGRQLLPATDGPDGLFYARLGKTP